ncbi:MAG TPA: PAS domain S-box protein [Actinomycetota bacterium]|nr:PAS domain S-box protein [Actinomycetota bacterium]
MPERPEARAGPRALWRRVDAAVPLVLKIVVPTLIGLVVVGGAVGTFIVRDTRRDIVEASRNQGIAVAHAVDSRYREGASEPSVFGAFLEGLNRTASYVARIRVYRSDPTGLIVWADSGLEGTAARGPDPGSEDGSLDEDLIPIGSDLDRVWVGVTIDRGAVAAAVDRSRSEVRLLLGAGALTAVIALGAAVYGFVLRRVNRLSRVARKAAAGDLSVRPRDSDVRPGRDLLMNVSGQFGRLLEVVDSRHRQQAAVAEFGQLALSGADVESLCEIAVQLAARGLDVEVGTVVELSGDRFVVRATYGWPDDFEAVPIPLDSQAGYTVRGLEPVVVEDMENETRFTPSPNLVALGVQSGVTVRIPGASGPFGVLAAHTLERRAFTDDDAHFLTAMANSLGAALRHRRAQEELAQAEERYRTLVEQVPAVVYVNADDDVSTARYISPVYERMFGYTAQERMADPGLWSRLLHPEDRERVMALSQDTNRTGEPFRCEYRMIARDGRVVWVRDEAVLLRDEAGRTLGWQGFLTDITERKWAEDALRRVMLQNKLILDSAGEGIFGLDREGRITFVNPAAAQALGWTVEELVGQPGHPMIHHSRADGSVYEPEDCPIYAALRDGTTRRVDDEVFWRKDGSSFPVEYTSTPLREDGRLSGAVVTFADITERKRATETLRQAYEREREAVDRLKQVDEMKNAFLSAVSHELRTPLSAVLGYALTLRQEEVNLPTEERFELLERLAANAQKLERLLGDLLDVDRLERGIIEPSRHPVDVGALAERIAGEIELPGRPIEVDAERVVAEVDGPKVERIVENLLVNAGKHTPGGTPVTLRVRAEEGGVGIAVEDRGRGVPDELKEAVFRPFERGDGELSHAPGTGIGLSLVSRFAELHGGRAWVEDRPGGGASFRVFLPMVSSPNGEGRPSDPPPARSDHAAAASA